MRLVTRVRDDHHYARREGNPAAVKKQMKAVQAPGFPDTREHYQIYQYLKAMPCCTEVMVKERGDRPLANTIVIAMHHIDGKAYGALSVLREWGATDMVAVFVGYNQLMEQIYRPELNEIPSDLFRTCIINAQPVKGQPLFAEGVYSIVQSFSKFPRGEELPNAAFNRIFKQGGGKAPMDFLQAMQSLTVFLLLRTLARARKQKKKIVVFEDGGYLHPIINQACLENWSVADLRRHYQAPPEPKTDQALPASMAEALAGTFVGTTEYTRNGYNRSAALEAQYRKMAYPLFSIACSDVKTRFEGDGIAQACIAAITSVLYSAGVAVSPRTVLCLGSRGNIGRFFMQHIAGMLVSPADQLYGCDLKVAWPPSKPGDVPSWSVAWDVPNKPCKLEVAAWKKLPKDVRLSIDLVYGVTGGPTVDHPTIDGDDLDEWLAGTTRPHLFLVSGSTKTSEFINVLRRLNEMLRTPKGKLTVAGRRVKSITPAPIDDQLADAAVQEMYPKVKLPIKRNFGTQFTFVIETAAGPATRTVYLLNNTMPVNFMFYGTPTETLDYSYAQLLDITAMLARRAAGLKQPAVCATDYTLAATTGVWKATAIDHDYPVPQAPGASLPDGD